MMKLLHFFLRLTLAFPVVRGIALFLCRRTALRPYGFMDHLGQAVLRRRLGPAPWAPNLEKLETSKVALITTAGFFR